MKRLVPILIFAICTISLHSQEVVIDCGNPALSDYSARYFAKYGYKVATSDTLELPFFDDFSASYMYPDSSKWDDRYAYINNSVGKNPISIGVATLDALDEYGRVYATLPIGMSDVADYLTSKPINMQRNASDSIYLSFFYQCGGNGNMPELRDSLVLQFYSVAEDEWHSVWKVGGGAVMSNFEQVLIPVRDSIWLQKGFRFRFLNYVSISSNYEPSWQSNVDQWNLDFIILDTNRTYDDTIIEDVAMIKNVGPFLKDYRQVPWSHFLHKGRTAVYDSITFSYANLQDATHNINRQYDVYDKDETSSLIPARTYIDYHCGDDSENINANEEISYTKKFCYFFNDESYQAEDSAKFLIRANLRTDVAQVREYYRWNDTVRFYQDFKNFYAYDDGTAEKGYGISGQGTANASLAYKFEPYMTDTLYGVYIYFNRTQNDGNVKYFYLTVWENNNGVPGDTIVSRLGVRPSFANELNGYVYYPLDTAVVINGPFYVGWIKTTNDMLNCGLDTENDAHDKIFYNVSGTWQNSIISGALMIRPVFGYELRQDASAPIEHIAPQCSIYPNPATTEIYIENNYDFSGVMIYDNLGRLVMQSGSETIINVSGLPEGTYFVRPYSDKEVFETVKILIMR
ncbi:MAG: T9SS type A sorting domain-containing protein [Bacteroidales bacterium]|nr:T9SS type A sorting domain-containing protein [Bacteroidales bacterium]